MNIIKWNKKFSKKILKRQVFDLEKYRQIVRPMILEVKKRGDKALAEFTQKFDGCKVKNFKVAQPEIKKAVFKADKELLNALKIAKQNITKFEKANTQAYKPVKILKGITCGRIIRPIESAGLYVPAGGAPLVSTLLMLAVPAKLAGVQRIVVCTPPQKDGKANSSILAACGFLGISEVYNLGGAQAIAAMAYGTKTIQKVDKIAGPGNIYVTAAKAEVGTDPEGAAIDMLAGPSELLIIADSKASEKFIASDLIAQAEHDVLAQVVLISNSQNKLLAVWKEINRQILTLPRKEIALRSLRSAKFILAKSILEAITISNLYAPEHLSLQVKNPKILLPSIQNAGSVFLGNFSTEAAGDYCSGTNHSLPTLGQARVTGGVSVRTFQKIITTQELKPSGLRKILPAISTLARIEGLEGHARSAEIRLRSNI